ESFQIAGTQQGDAESRGRLREHPGGIAQGGGQVVVGRFGDGDRGALGRGGGQQFGQPAEREGGADGHARAGRRRTGPGEDRGRTGVGRHGGDGVQVPPAQVGAGGRVEDV